MILDRTTYEAWLLDRIEGNLTPTQERELDAFLAANPDLRADIHELPAVDGEGPDAFDGKDALKKRLPPLGLPDATRLNEFLIARLEGDLDATQLKALDRFLYEHPQFVQDAKRISASRADASPVPFEDKPSIERHFPPQGMPDMHRVLDFLIAAQEGDLTQAQQRALDELLRTDPVARKEQRLVAAATVVRERVVFAGKADLKKREVRVIALWQRYAVAASIALLLGFAWWMSRTEQGDGPAIADKEKQRNEVVTPRVEPSTRTQDPVGTPDVKSQDPAPKEPTDTMRGTDAERSTPGATDRNMKGSHPTPDQEPAQRPAPSVPLDVLAPEPQLVETPAQDQEQPAPEVAETPVPEASHAVSPTTDGRAVAVAATSPDEPGGTAIGTALANTVRRGVLETDDRTSGLDGDDALAMANKAIGAITGGKGRVDVRPKGARSGWKLRLGQNLAISASTGR